MNAQNPNQPRRDSEWAKSLLREIKAGADDSAVAPLQPAEEPTGNLPSGPPNIDNYTILKLHGEGGMGCVYLARHNLTLANVVLKVIRPEIISPNSEQRFLNEIQLTSQLKNLAGIVPVLYAGRVGGRLYYAMEYIQGVDLASMVSKYGCLTAKMAAKILGTVARHLADVHQKNVIHRDIKPANIVLDKNSFPYLVDFGLAKCCIEAPAEMDKAHAEEDWDTLKRTVAGTPEYIAPECFPPHCRPTIASDIFSLGVTLYYLLCGEVPFPKQGSLKGEHSAEALLEALRKMAMPEELERICLKCLWTEPERRYDTATELADDLDRFAELADDRDNLRKANFTAPRLWGGGLSGAHGPTKCKEKLQELVKKLGGADALSAPETKKNLRAELEQFTDWEGKILLKTFDADLISKVMQTERYVSISLKWEYEWQLTLSPVWLRLHEASWAVEVWVTALGREIGDPPKPPLPPPPPPPLPPLWRRASLAFAETWDPHAATRLLMWPRLIVGMAAATGALLGLAVEEGWPAVWAALPYGSLEVSFGNLVRHFLSGTDGCIVAAFLGGLLGGTVFLGKREPLWATRLAFLARLCWQSGWALATALIITLWIREEAYPLVAAFGVFVATVVGSGSRPSSTWVILSVPLITFWGAIIVLPAGVVVECLFVESINPDWRTTELACTLGAYSCLLFTGLLLMFIFDEQAANKAEKKWEYLPAIRYTWRFGLPFVLGLMMLWWWFYYGGQTGRLDFTSSVTAVTFVPGASEEVQVLFGFENGSVGIYSFHKNRGGIVRKGEGSRVISLRLSDDLLLVSGFKDGAWLWDPNEPNEVTRLERVKGSAASVAVSPIEPEHILVGMPNVVFLYDTIGGLIYQRNIEAFSVDFSRDGKYALAGGECDICCFEVKTGEVIRKLIGHEKRVKAVTFTSDDHILSADTDTIRLWDFKTGTEIRAFDLDKGWRKEKVLVIAFDSTARRAVWGGGQGGIHLLDLDTGQELRCWRGHHGFVNSVAFSDNGQFVASAGNDGTVRLWRCPN
jgi:serine/threonine protein kinase